MDDMTCRGAWVQGRILGGKRRRIEERKRRDGGGKAKRSGIVRCRNDIKYSSMSLPYPVFLSTHESQKFTGGILWRYNKSVAPLTSTGP